VLKITLRPGAFVEPSLVFRQIAVAGYQARTSDVRLSAEGTLTKEGDRLLLTLHNVKPGPQTFTLLPAPSKNTTEEATNTAAFNRLAARAGQRVEVTGQWRAGVNKTDHPTLLISGAGEPLKPKVGA
jgi:hypothetical protein